MTDRSPDDEKASHYESNVFVNCPFDQAYRPLRRPLLFTLVYLGCNPRIASERLDSGENRIDKICELICSSRFGIHDLSRCKADRAEEFYRLNMPLELGIDYGARRYGQAPLDRKLCLILTSDPYDYKKAMSDISGVDVKHHGDEPDEVVRAVRDWFYETAGMRNPEYPSVIWNRFNDFTSDLFESRLASGISQDDVREDINRMSVSEYLDSAKNWVDENRDS